MNKRFYFLLILAGITQLLLCNLSAAADFKDSEITHVEFPSWFINSPFMELDGDLAKARTNGKKGLMVLYTTEGCSYCGLFIKKHLHDPEIVSQIQKHFDSVGMEIFDDTSMVDPQGNDTTIKKFSKQEGVMFSPTILFYGKDGERLFRITGYQSPERFKTSLQYVIGNHYQSQSFAEYQKKTTKPKTELRSSSRLKQDSLFEKPPHLLQRNVIPANEPLLVIFEKAGSSEVEEFHNVVLGSNDVRTSLEKFEVVRLDATDNIMIVVMPDGKRTTPAAWYKKTKFSRLPALVFFDEKGREAISTDTLVLRQRMMNCINFTLERAHLKGWSYQRFARSKAIERSQKKKMTTKK